MSELIVEAKGLTRVFPSGTREIRAVDGIDIQIRRGEFVSIMGPSGSGKTSLLNLVGLLDRPSGGTLLFEGQDVLALRGGDLDDLRLRRMGFVFQTFNLMPTFSALENVTFPMELAGMPREKRVERARELLASLGLAERLGHRPRELSAGENQRVAIARALANRPILLLADEPTGNLDSKNTREIADLLKRLNAEQGVAIVLVTHDAEVAGTATRLLHMTDGRLS